MLIKLPWWMDMSIFFRRNNRLHFKMRLFVSEFFWFLWEFICAKLGMAFGHLNFLNYGVSQPENILLDNHGHVCSTHYGLTKELEIVEGGDHEARTFCRTPEYLAPDIIEGLDHGKSWCSSIWTHYWKSSFHTMYKMALKRALRINQSTSPLWKDVIQHVTSSNLMRLFFYFWRKSWAILSENPCFVTTCYKISIILFPYRTFNHGVVLISWLHRMVENLLKREQVISKPVQKIVTLYFGSKQVYSSLFEHKVTVH